jgi:hypothetical protein
MVALTDEKGRTMSEQTHDGRYGRQDSDLSDDDAWWLSRRRQAPRPSYDEPAAAIEEPRRERTAPEWWRVDQPEPVSTWSSLENTIALRADQARTRIADIANSVHASGHHT